MMREEEETGCVTDPLGKILVDDMVKNEAKKVTFYV